VAVVTDITERKQLEVSLLEADRRKNEFLAILAHELRNPVAAISNATRVMQERRASDEQRRQMADMLGRQIAHLTRLVDDLLDVARITRGQISLKKETMPLAAVVERAVDTVRPVVQAKKQEVIATLSETKVLIDGDITRMSQVIGNLLHNAAKFSPERSFIYLTAGVEQGWAVVRVRDEGSGIAPEVLPHIFDLFHQASQGIDREQGGLGIGLTVVRKLVEMHGGTVEARSPGLGQGTEFILRLPVIAEDGRESEQTQAPHGPPVVRKVLVVDDNLDSAESLAVLLRVAGHEAHIAADGLSALEVFDSFRPNAVVLDIGLPKMDGYAVARELRARYPGARLQLLALTGYGRDEDRARSREAGFDGHLTKPVEFERLLELLRREAADAPSA
jgi:CheY-like chemotaxis protein